MVHVVLPMAYAFVTPAPRLARIILLVMMVSIADAQDTVSSGSCAVDPSSPNYIRSPNFPSNYGDNQACTITPTALAIGAPLTASFCMEFCCPRYNMMPPPPPLPPFSPFAQSPMISLLAAPRMPPLSPQAPPPHPPPTPPVPPSPPSPPLSPPSPPGGHIIRCALFTTWGSESSCDDGGPCAESGNCAFGDDCSDCGPRDVIAPPPLVLLPP